MRYRIYIFDGWGMKIFSSVKFKIKKLYTDYNEAREALNRLSQRDGQYLLVNLDKRKIIGMVPIEDVFGKEETECTKQNG